MSAPHQPLNRKPFHRANGPQGDCAMSFEEIGRALGVSHQRASALYSSGMRKLLAQPEALGMLLALAAELAAARESRVRGVIGW